MSARALLFDMDGTLVDSSATVAHVWGSFATRHRLPVEDVLRFGQGRRKEAIVRHFLGEGVDIPALVQHLDAESLRTSHWTRPMAGAPEFLETIHTVPSALVTSAARSVALSRMGAAGLSMPQIVVSGDDVRLGKPAPECFELAAALLAVDPRDTIAFEDASAGAEAAVAAGCRVIMVGSTCFTHENLLLRVRDFTGLRATVDDAGVHLWGAPERER